MKAKELRELSDDELRAHLNQAHEELFNLRFQKATRQLQNTARYGEVRNDIARILTILSERELGQTA
jgi:large subunit ribosomal protein L29